MNASTYQEVGHAVGVKIRTGQPTQIRRGEVIKAYDTR